MYKRQNVDNSFKIGPNCPTSTAVDDCSTVSLFVEDFRASEVIINLYPNPTKDYFNIKLSRGLDQTRIKEIRIFSSTAKMIYSSNVYEETIRIDDYSPGIYFIQINFDNDQITKKLIIH